MRTLPICVSALVAATASAQRVLHSHALAPYRDAYQTLRPAGDTNADGKADFVVVVRNDSNPGATSYEVVIASGVNAAPLHTVSGFQAVRDAVGFGDANLDGQSDVAVVTNDSLRVYSGATGTLLYSQPPPSSEAYMAVAELGDWNGDGRADIAVATYNNNGQNLVRLLRGHNGTQMAASLPFQNNNADCTLRSLGDLNQDGKTDLALTTRTMSTYVLQTDPMVVQLTIPSSGHAVELRTEDLDGDGIAELLLHRSGDAGNGTIGRIEVLDALTGNLRLTLRVAPGLSTNLTAEVTGVGDLNQDGTTDLVAQVSPFSGIAGLQAFSGSTGARLWALDGNAFLSVGSPLCTIGDCDGDGLPDLAVRGSVQLSTRGWLIVAGRVIADAMPQAGACGGGPFLPRLGMTRPILGQPVTIAGTDGPPATNGLLLFSLRPNSPTYLGASSCFAWFAVGNATVLQVLTAPQWNLLVPIPNLPPLVGLEVALQSYYAPTNGPLGYDLGNGIWARLGYP